VASFASAGTTHGLPNTSRIGATVAVGGFAGSVLAALAILVPAKYPIANATTLKGLVEKDWEHSDDVASRRVAKLQAAMLVSYRERNRRKAIGIFVVVLCQAIAIIALAVAVAAEVWR
jgi:hypothetical protein